MEQYDMDNLYYRVERDGEWLSLCFSDLTPQEVESLTEDYSVDHWRQVAAHLASQLRDLGAFLKEEGYIKKEEENE